MSRKVCRTEQGTGVCCTAAQQGLLNRPFKFTIQSGCMAGQQRCGECQVVQSRSKKHPNTNVFQFRFHKNSECGIGPAGCAALAQGGPGARPQIAPQSTLSLPGF